MHARCDTDPLDFATDLCQQCGGEYCDDHLVFPYGPKRPPLCKTCAIAVGGVRSGAALVRKRSRSQVKRRRAELRSLQHERRSPGFEFFEADAPFRPTDPGLADDLAATSAPAAVPTDDELPASEPETDRVPDASGRAASLWRRRRSSDAALPAAAEPEPELEPEPEPRRRLGANLPDPTPARTSATVLLTRLRESGAVPSSVERRSRSGADVLSTDQGPHDALPPGWATPAQEPEPLLDPEALLPAPPVAPAPLPERPPVPAAEQHHLPVADLVGPSSSDPGEPEPEPALPPQPALRAPLAPEPHPALEALQGHHDDEPAIEVQPALEPPTPPHDDEPALAALDGSHQPPPALGVQAPPEVPVAILAPAVADTAPPPPPPPPPTPASDLHASPAPMVTVEQVSAHDSGPVSVVDDDDRPIEAEPPATDEVSSEDIDVAVEDVPAPLRGPDPSDPPVVPDWLLRAEPPPPLAPPRSQASLLSPLTPLTTTNSAHELVLPPPPPPPGTGPAEEEPWIPPALRGVDAPRVERLLEASKTDPAALGSLFGRAIGSPPAVQPQAPPPPPAGIDDGDDPWAGVPPALRGPGWRPADP